MACCGDQSNRNTAAGGLSTTMLVLCRARTAYGRVHLELPGDVTSAWHAAPVMPTRLSHDCSRLLTAVDAADWRNYGRTKAHAGCPPVPVAMQKTSCISNWRVHKSTLILVGMQLCNTLRVDADLKEHFRQPVGPVVGPGARGQGGCSAHRCHRPAEAQRRLPSDPHCMPVENWMMRCIPPESGDIDRRPHGCWCGWLLHRTEPPLLAAGQTAAC